MVSKRILIYRSGAIGDVMHTLPFVKLLRQRNPQASIEYIVGSKQLFELLENSVPYISKVWLAEKKSLVRDLRQVRAEGEVDEFVFLHSGWWKSWWLNFRYIGASKVTTYKRDDSLSAVANYASSYYPELKDQLFDDPYRVLESKVLNVEAGLSHRNEVKTDQDPNYICIVPGVGHLRPHRVYPLDKWLEFIDQVLKETDYQIKILGGPDELELKQAISINSDRVENLIGETSLLDLAKILENSEHLYSADTGILHIGAAVECPSTALYSITSPKRFGPFNPRAKIIQAEPCMCNPSSSNRPKNCNYLQDGYASCMQAFSHPYLAFGHFPR